MGLNRHWKSALYKHFYEKFPEQVAKVNSLTRTNDALRTELDDYEEICTWLEAQDRSAARDRDELEQAQTLVRELESEILHELEKQDDGKS